MKDWTGNKSTAFGQLGARNFAQNEREHQDYYASPPQVIDDLFGREEFSENIWECACGEGHLSKRMEELGKKVYSTDLIDRGYGISGIDFLLESKKWKGDIITNPPYRLAQQFVEQAIELIDDGNKVAMLLKIHFLEGKARKIMYEKYPLKTLYVWSGRISCALNGKFENIKHGSPMMFGWYVWEKGFQGDTIIKHL